MIDSKRIRIEWYSSQCFNCIVPISQKIIDSCPIESSINAEAYIHSIEKTIDYDFLYESMLYELKNRKNIYEAVSKIYSSEKSYGQSMDELFGTLKIIPEKDNNNAHYAKNIFDTYSALFPKSHESIKNNIDRIYINFLNPYYEGYHEKSFEVFFGQKNPRYAKSTLSKFMENNKERNLQKISFGHECDYEENGKIINIYLFKPDKSDYRNLMHPMHEKKLMKFYSNLIESQSEYFYSNHIRPFEDLLSAILGKELAINYLNHLEKSL